MHTQARFHAVTSLVALSISCALLLAACGSASNSSTAEDSGRASLDGTQAIPALLDATPTATTVGAAQVTPEVLEAEPDAAPVVARRQSPIDAAIGHVEVDAGDYAVYRTQLDIDRYNDASACMRAVGFDVPLGWAPLQYGPAVAGTDSDLRRNVGYGVAYGLQFGIDNQSTTATSDHAAWVAGMRAEWEEFKNSASESEFDAFADARRQCMADMAGEFPDIFYPEHSSGVYELVASGREAIYESSELREVWSDWSACMAEQGYLVAGRDDFIRELSPLVAEASLDLQTNQEPFPAEKLAECQTLADDVRAQEFAIVEIDVACADSVQLDQRVEEIVYEMELQFVQEYGDKIAALIAAEH